MTIALAGYGYVGRAIHAHLFKKQQMVIVDPVHTNNTLRDIDDLRGVIICVPTPSAPDGSCDVRHVVEVLEETPPDVPVLIKSTVSIGGWDMIRLMFPKHSLAYSPEFLRAATAERDVATQEQVILAGDKLDFWRTHYAEHFDADLITMPVEEAIATKYFRNSFLATKVSFFNEMFDFCNAYGIDFETVRHGVGSDPRIGHSHTFLNEQGEKGWGGACFPKDTLALLTMADQRGARLSILANAVWYNHVQTEDEVDDHAAPPRGVTLQ
jgi:UDPglucose 6-dehydrogenase